MTDTLLAHLSGGFGQGRENLATDTLAYVLRHPEVAEAFQRHARRFAPDLPELARYTTQVGGEDDSGIRDLVGKTAADATPLVVEVKFRAPLTRNQPVTYLEALRHLRSPGLLLFLTPEARARSVWTRLLQHCREASLPVECREDAGFIATVESATMALTTWSQLLDDLSSIPLSTGNRQVLGEVAQLRGLCEREDREGFRPLEPAFLESDVGRSLADTQSLISEAVRLLRNDGVVTARKLKWSAGSGWIGKYFRLEKRRTLLHVNFIRWGREADIPLWLWITPRPGHLDAKALEDLRQEKPPGLFDGDGHLMVPVYLPAGADRDECLDAVTATIRRVHGLLPVASGVRTDGDEDDVEDDEVEFEAE